MAALLRHVGAPPVDAHGAKPKRGHVLSLLAALRTAYENGQLGDKNHELLPDIPPDSRELFLYLTLSATLNYQRRSENLWSASLATWNDDETRFVFDPSAGAHAQQIRMALAKHGLAIQPSRQTAIWVTLSTTLASEYRSDPRALLRACHYRVDEVQMLMKTRRADFPYLGGPKLRNYWLYLLWRHTKPDLLVPEAISIIPDIHVRRATVYLGLSSEEGARKTDDVEDIWRSLLESTGLHPCEIHTVIWHWSRAGFPPV